MGELCLAGSLCLCLTRLIKGQAKPGETETERTRQLSKATPGSPGTTVSRLQSIKDQRRMLKAYVDWRKRPPERTLRRAKHRSATLFPLGRSLIDGYLLNFFHESVVYFSFHLPIHGRNLTDNRLLTKEIVCKVRRGPDKSKGKTQATIDR